MSHRTSPEHVLNTSAMAIVHADRWAPIDPNDVLMLAEARGGQWLRNARERCVLPGAGPDGEARVRAQAARTEPSAMALRDELLKQARMALERQVEPYRTPEQVTEATGQTLFDTRQELWMRRVGDELVLFSVAAMACPHDKALCARIRDHALAVCRYPQWGVREPNQDLAAGHMARGLAIAWSWHRGLWDEAEAAFIRDTLRTRVNTLCDAICGGVFWAGAYQENHNHVGAAAVGICGAAFIGDLPEDAARWLAAAQLNFEAVARHANADGSSPEGVPYWSYGASYILQYIEGVRGVVDVAPFYEGDWLRNMAAYRLHASTSGLGATLPWGDAPVRDYYGPHHLLNRLAAEYRDPCAQYLAAHLDFPPQHGADVFAWNWLWHDPSVPSRPPESLDAHMPVVDAVDTRSGWGAGDYLLAIKSGYTNRNHSHLDAGAIAFAFGGEWLLPSPGYGKGSGDQAFWDATDGRWRYFSNATESHTTLLVNGKNQRHDVHARGRVVRFSSTPRVLWTEVDLGEAYVGTTMIKRGVLHRRGDYVFVFDDAELSAPGSVEWLLQVRPDAEMSEREARVDGLAGALTVRLLSPEAALYPRKPDSLKVDVPPERLKTFAARLDGDRASFRSVLLPVFGGEARPIPKFTRLDGDRYRIDGDGWRDELAYSAQNTRWSSEAGDMSASGRLVLARYTTSTVSDLFVVDATSFVLPMAVAKPAVPATMMASRVNDGLWVLTGVAREACELSLTSPWRCIVADDGNLLLATTSEPCPDYARWQRQFGAVGARRGVPACKPQNVPPVSAGDRAML